MSYFQVWPFQHPKKFFYFRDVFKNLEANTQIIDFFIMYLELKKLCTSENMNLEIETRPGSFWGSTTEESSAISALKRISNKNLVIVNSSLFELDELAPFNLKDDYTKEKVKYINDLWKSISINHPKPVQHLPQAYHFTPSVTETNFYSRLEFLKAGTSTDGVEEGPVDFSIDISTSERSTRLTFDMIKQRFTKTKKVFQSKLDLMHHQFGYRIGGSIEVNDELTWEKFYSLIRSKGCFDYARVKLRWHYIMHNRYDFCFTKVFELDLKQGEIHKGVLDALYSIFSKVDYQDKNPDNTKNENKKSPENLKDLGQKILGALETNEIHARYEIESEYIDSNHLLANYQSCYQNEDILERLHAKSYFYRNVEQFLINSEILFFSNYNKETDGKDLEEMHLTEYKKHFSDQRVSVVEYPKIGDYLENVLVKRKREKRQKHAKVGGPEVVSKVINELPTKPNGNSKIKEIIDDERRNWKKL